jgi:hypothetical protein
MTDSSGQGGREDDDSSYGGSGYPPPPPAGGSGYPPPPGQGYPPPGQGYGQPAGYPPPPGQPYPPGGYGYPGGAWDAERPRGWSGLAIAALIVGVVVPCLGLLIAIPLGIAALIRIRRTGDKGKALAIVGMVASVLWVAGAVALVVWIATSTAERNEAGVIVEAGRLDVGDIRDGDCLTIDGLESSGEIGLFDIEGLPCAESHNAEVASLADLAGGDDYPGESQVRQQAGTACAAEQASLPPGLTVYPLFPTESLWGDADNRRAICLAVRGDYSDMTGKQLN